MSLFAIVAGVLARTKHPRLKGMADGFLRGRNSAALKTPVRPVGKPIVRKWNFRPFRYRQRPVIGINASPSAKLLMRFDAAI